MPAPSEYTATTEEAQLPIGTKITRREYSWAVELPPPYHGYLSCGVTLEKAIQHALSGKPQQAIRNLEALAGVMA